MSLPENQIRDIGNGYSASIEIEMKSNKQKVTQKKRELNDTEEKLVCVGGKVN